MFVRLVVTLIALSIASASAGEVDPHRIDVAISTPIRLESPHIFLGVAVLGSRVGRLESGWLVKQKDAGLLHIDWTKSGNWDGLTRPVEGPRDTSISQLNAVVAVIKGLGYAASAIRAWRTVAPVGYDGYGEGDKALTIGEILVDLGPPKDARAALERWSSVVRRKDDPFDAIPHTNVRYADELYVQPDCDATMRDARELLVLKATALASSLTANLKTSAAFQQYDARKPYTLLCPSDLQPRFMRAGGGPPFQLRQEELTLQQDARVSFALPHASMAAIAKSGPAGGEESVTKYAFALPERYAATIGGATVTVTPDAAVIRFTYELGDKERKGYLDDRTDVEKRIANLSAASVAAADTLVVRRVQSVRDEYVDVYARLHAVTPERYARIAAVMVRADINDKAANARFVEHCEPAAQRAMKLAIARSRRKAEVVAGLLHVRVSGLAAARITGSFEGSAVCGISPNAPMIELAKAMQSFEGFPRGYEWVEPVLGGTVNIAWTLSGSARSGSAAEAASYKASVRGIVSEDELGPRAFTQAMREAVVDNRRINSVYEAEPFTWNHDGANEVSETLVVLR